MVQLAPQAPHYKSNIDYWKLRDPAPLPRERLLSSLGRDTIDGASIDRFRALAIRQQRGLLIYESCDHAELQKFCAERQLKIQSTDVKSLIETLKVADSHATFRLLDLPSELRCNVYEWYYASLRVDHGARAPPLCEVSRLVRKESLPLIQAYLRPALRIKCCNPVGTFARSETLRDQDYTTTTEQRAGSAQLFHTGHLDLKALRHLSINASWKIGSLPPMNFRWEIDRAGEAESFTIQSTHPREPFDNCAYGCPEGIRPVLDKRFGSFLQSILPAVDQTVHKLPWMGSWARQELLGCTTISDIERMFQDIASLMTTIPPGPCYTYCYCAKAVRNPSARGDLLSM